MFLGVPLGELALLAAAVFVAGIVTGIFAGLFGIGRAPSLFPCCLRHFLLRICGRAGRGTHAVMR